MSNRAAHRMARLTRAEALTKKRFASGAEAARCGKGVHQCPFKSFVARSDWEDGWRSAAPQLPKRET